MGWEGVGLGFVWATRLSVGWVPDSTPLRVPRSSISDSVMPSAPAAGVSTRRYCVYAFGAAMLNDLVCDAHAQVCPVRRSTVDHVVPSFEPCSVHADGPVPVAPLDSVYMPTGRPWGSATVTVG